jgi:hypothetical protein
MERYREILGGAAEEEEAGADAETAAEEEEEEAVADAAETAAEEEEEEEEAGADAEEEAVVAGADAEEEAVEEEVAGADAEEEAAAKAAFQKMQKDADEAWRLKMQLQDKRERTMFDAERAAIRELYWRELKDCRECKEERRRTCETYCEQHRMMIATTAKEHLPPDFDK